MEKIRGEEIFSIRTAAEFENIALEVFRYQALHNAVYREFLSHLGRNPAAVDSVDSIPFMPIDFFRTHRVITGDFIPELTFESSGTTGNLSSFHFVKEASLYRESFLRMFRLVFSEPSEWLIAALLPSYEERGNSSLIYMVNHLVSLTGNSESGFYSNNPALMAERLERRVGEGKKAMLIGVSYALLDMAAGNGTDLSGVTVVETGGMKGRRKEITRSELHSQLKNGLRCENIWSEYGMTELLSQAWSSGDGIFRCPPWMKISLREINDPFSPVHAAGVTGGINIIDLANINSCSFIATQDLGRLSAAGGFEVLGRFDNADVRGCNLLYQ